MSKRARRRNRKKKDMESKLTTVAVVIFVLGIVAGYYGLNSGSQSGQEVTPAMIAKGKELYSANCTTCHGISGNGAFDTAGNFLAPPLDDSAHAWHHTDEFLVDIILNGSPRNPRMIAWKSKLSEDDARTIVDYIKSLWSPRIKACQGPKHMMCMQGMM